MKQNAKTWGTIVATTLAVSAVWAFFYLRVTELKDQQLANVRQENERLTKFGPGMDVLERVENKIAAIDDRLISLSLTMPMDPISGRFTLGEMMAGGPTRLTFLMADAANLTNQKQFGLAEKKIREMEAIFPRFQGIVYARYWNEVGKGNNDEAFVDATNLIAKLSSDTRVLPIYDFAVSQLILHGQRKRAEGLCLAALKLDSTNQNRKVQFKQAFGYEPSTE